MNETTPSAGAPHGAVRGGPARAVLPYKTVRALWVAACLVPALLLFSAFVAYPVITAMAYAFSRWDGIVRGGFAGLDNFHRLLVQYPYRERMAAAFWHNAWTFVLTMLVQNGAAMLFAVLLAGRAWGVRFYRAVFFMPVVLSLVVVGFLWQLFLNPVWGAVNKLLALAGLGALARPWLGDPHTALVALVLVNAWRWVGFPTIVFLAGIQAIPEDYLEAARLDGAGPATIFRRIMLPLLAAQVNIIVILTFIGAFNWFELPYVMEGVTGEPFHSTDVLGLLFYRSAFGAVDTGNPDVGLGSAIAVVMFALILVTSGVGAVYLRRREVEM
ncbi:MAG TPA: sugar ABC transporter permease [bacterium]|nr:sugar ABC transporter permease [bacterium]